MALEKCVGGVTRKLILCAFLHQQEGELVPVILIWFEIEKKVFFFCGGGGGGGARVYPAPFHGKPLHITPPPRKKLLLFSQTNLSLALGPLPANAERHLSSHTPVYF